MTEVKYMNKEKAKQLLKKVIIFLVGLALVLPIGTIGLFLMVGWDSVIGFLTIVIAFAGLGFVYQRNGII